MHQHDEPLNELLREYLGIDRLDTTAAGRRKRADAAAVVLIEKAHKALGAGLLPDDVRTILRVKVGGDRQRRALARAKKTNG